jgi:hypothetical protein
MADAISSQALSDLIRSIYDCALDPSRWDQTLADTMDVLECHGLGLHLTDLRQDRLLIHKAVGLEPPPLKHVPEINATLAEAFASKPSLDEPHVVSRHVTTAYIEASPHFQGFVRPSGIVDMMAFCLMQTPIYLSCFTGARHERQGIITEREIELGKLLLPHLRRAVTISRVLDVRTIEGARMAEALDAEIAPGERQDVSEDGWHVGLGEADGQPGFADAGLVAGRKGEGGAQLGCG